MNEKRSELKNVIDNEIRNMNRENVDVNLIEVCLRKLKNKINMMECKSDSRFKPYGRMLFLREELTKNIAESKYLDALFDISDFLDSTRIIPEYENNDPSIVNENKVYFDEDIICNEEKEAILGMINELMDSINNLLIKIPDSLIDFVYFDNGYVNAKQKLPTELESEYNKFVEQFYLKNSDVTKEIVDKINNMPNGAETTIAELIDYNPNANMIDPLTQGIVFSSVETNCKNIGISIVISEESFGGLAYNYKFKKIIINNKVREFAKEHGYENVEYLNEWNGYDCYEPILKDGEMSFTGAPLIILDDKKGNIRMSTYDEATQHIKDSRQ